MNLKNWRIFFTAETKGTMETLNLKRIEKEKIDCAKIPFKKLSSADVKSWLFQRKSDIIDTHSRTRQMHEAGRGGSTGGVLCE